jgi:hypothetical protein
LRISDLPSEKFSRGGRIREVGLVRLERSRSGASRQGADQARATKRKGMLPVEARNLRCRSLAQLGLGHLRRLGCGLYSSEANADGFIAGPLEDVAEEDGSRTHLRPSDGPTRI